MNGHQRTPLLVRAFRGLTGRRRPLGDAVADLP
jgi:hypothetical protein